MTTTAPADIPGVQLHNSSNHAMLALGLAQQGALNGKSVQAQGEQFSRVVHRLANDPGFDVVAAKTAAEYLKTQAMRVDQFWARFGLRRGTYLALLPALLLYAVTEGQPYELLVGLGVALATLTFVAGHYADLIQIDMKTGESLLKAATKRRTQLQQANQLVPAAVGINLVAVEKRVRKQHQAVKWIMVVALAAFLIFGVAVFLQVRTAGLSAA
ncbi:hypothetical protein IHN32_01320 [Deinococcus sp. 14RED07]|uniref:hypothetical protein n=1 Tax=unclassified Deinococcus TaxID=2623546 RepID=UPI001E52C534|nr:MULTISPECIES: hypothetical protein [unclassified Deinococcus]MCD0164671.1 hypothetical protein [Deinococcus sp. 12RED42]MCD0174593.1 hypothetical protein [Deinococcus sp. 14RED07]